MTIRAPRRIKALAEFDNWSDPIQAIKKIISSLPFKVKLVGKLRAEKGITTAIFYAPVEVITQLRTSLEKLDFNCQYTSLKQSGYQVLSATKEWQGVEIEVFYHSQLGFLTIQVRSARWPLL